MKVPAIGHPSTSREVSPLLQTTVGLMQSLTRAERHRLRESPVPGSFTSSDCRFRGKRGMPLLAGRYSFVDHIKGGTFSQVVLAEDQFGNVTAGSRRRKVAIKVRLRGAAPKLEMGRRERHCNMRRTHSVKRVLQPFHLGVQMCFCRISYISPPVTFPRTLL